MRKTFVDNLRSFVIVLVLIFHVIATFNSNGSPLNFNGKGLAYMDAIGYMIYPWFMILLFAVSGMVAKYALEKRNLKNFLHERTRSLFIPFICYQVLLGIPVSMFSFKINNIEESLRELPAIAIHIIRVVNGMGPSWFMIQLFISSLIFALFYSMMGKNANHKMSALAEKTNLLILIGLFVPIYLSSQYLYIAYTFRFLLFTLSFVLGFYVFSSDKVQDILAKYSAHLLIAGLILGAVQTYIYWGQSFQLIVNEFVVVLFSWIMVLAMLGIFKRRFDQQNRMWTFLNKYSYSFYIFHYLPLTVGGYYIDQWVHAGMIKYLLLFIWTFAASMVMHHIIMILPVVPQLLGMKKWGK
jgi:glucan biosynthesis protein C